MEAGEERRNDEEAEEGFHNGEVPFGILISNLFKFPTTVTRERIVMEMELYGIKVPEEF